LEPRFPLNVPSRPLPKFRFFYSVTALLLVLAVAAVSAVFALYADVPFPVTIAVAVLTVAALPLFLAWTALYYAT